MDFIYNVDKNDVLFYMDKNGIFVSHINKAPSGIYSRVCESEKEWKEMLERVEGDINEMLEDDDDDGQFDSRT